MPLTPSLLPGRLVLHDMSPPYPAARVFVTSVANSGFTAEQIADMPMTAENRNQPRTLPIYSPPGMFQVLAKIEAACPTSEAAEAANVLTRALISCLKEGNSVEDSVAKVVSLYPGHVKHGVLYQLKSNPEKRTLHRFNRKAFVVSESDDVLGRLGRAQADGSVHVRRHEPKANLTSFLHIRAA